MTARRAAIAAVMAVLAFAAWARCHTIGPTIRDAFGAKLYPVIVAEAEPLDCDESVYAYIGKRIVVGDVMYRDLTENKPPGGYWLYALAVAIGGATETTIRVMPIPFVLATILIVAGVAGRLGGPIAAVAASLTYALMSTDPYLYGNGANMEHFINFFAAGSLGLMVAGWTGGRKTLLVAAGACVGAAALVKQVAALHLVVYLAAVCFRRDAGGRWDGRKALAEMGSIAVGFAIVWGVALLALTMQGAARSAYEDVIRYGGALATDTPPDPKEYPFPVRWITGNTDPLGLLPWPFGKTDGRAWWGAGSYPLWIASIPCMIALLASRSGPRRVVAAWTISAWLQVAAPRLFWQHYYLLPLPGVAISVAVVLADGSGSAKMGIAARRWKSAFVPIVIVATLLGAIGGTAEILRRSYLMVPPETLTIQDKGGAQWVVLRDLGRELGRRAKGWGRPRLFVWGIQSPLYLYSGIDGVTPQVFADPLIVAHASGNHPLIRPRIDRTMRDLTAHPPDLIFRGERPFPELLKFLQDRYISADISVRGRALPPGAIWVRNDRYKEFAEAGAAGSRSPTTPR